MFKMFGSNDSKSIQSIKDEVEEHIERHTLFQNSVREDIQDTCTFFREHHLERYSDKETQNVNNSICSCLEPKSK